jgi:hypothetical protein
LPGRVATKLSSAKTSRGAKLPAGRFKLLKVIYSEE